MLDVAPDDMVIVNPRTQHTELSYQANPLEYIVLGIAGVVVLFNQKDQGYTMVTARTNIARPPRKKHLTCPALR